MDLWCLTSILQVQGLESSNWKISRLSRHEDGNQAFPIFAMKKGRAPKGNSASNHHFAGTMLNFWGNETILPCDFEDSKGFQKAPLGSENTALPWLPNRSPKARSPDPTMFLPRFHQRILGRDGSANLYRRLPFDGHSLSHVGNWLRRLAVNRIAVNAWCFTLGMAQNLKTKKQVTKL